MPGLEVGHNVNWLVGVANESISRKDNSKENYKASHWLYGEIDGELQE